MVAAEMAALNAHYVKKLVLVSAAGLWRDDAPVADFYAMGPRDLEENLWADPEDEVARAASADSDRDETRALLALERVAGLAAVGKFLWPIPDRGLKKRIYRIKAPSMVLWGAEDKIICPVYATDLAQHLPMLERPQEFTRRVIDFLKG